MNRTATLSRVRLQKRESIFISLACAVIDTVTAVLRIVNTFIPEMPVRDYDPNAYDNMTMVEHDAAGAWWGGTG